MTSVFPETSKLGIRSVQYRDLDAIEILTSQDGETEQDSRSIPLQQKLQQVRHWYGLFKLLSLLPNPLQYYFCVYVAEQTQIGGQTPKLQGFIQISPFNKTRSTWRVEQVSVNSGSDRSSLTSDLKDVGSQLLRYCFETIWEARTWLLEVNVHEKDTLALYRQNGFQPLAQMTYWSLSADILEQLAQSHVELPNLLPVSNADAQLLYQLDCVSMPPLLRQVFDRHIQDFKTSFWLSLLTKLKQSIGSSDVASGYVFEPQRKAAIGYFKLKVCRDGSRPHQAELTVHPAYTYLYAKLLARMAQIVQGLPPQSLELASADYQHEREEYLEKLGARRVEHALLMSRSVWHKLKEAKPEGLLLSEVLQGLQPVPRTPIPSRIAWWKWSSQPTIDPPIQQESDSRSDSQMSGSTARDSKRGKEGADSPENGHHA